LNVSNTTILIGFGNQNLSFLVDGKSILVAVHVEYTSIVASERILDSEWTSTHILELNKI
jgi:hypothetical protein